jgi:hypothetical protein
MRRGPNRTAEKVGKVPKIVEGKADAGQQKVKEKPTEVLDEVQGSVGLGRLL